MSGQWPEWALPNSNIENWEDIAEMEAEDGTGMDVELESVVKKEIFDLIGQITAVESQSDLDKLVKTLDTDDQLELADVINTKKTRASKCCEDSSRYQ
jgi:hypothetical protein